MGKFITRRESGKPIDSPEALFRALRPGGNGVKHLWAHQADMLRDYAELPAETRDIAVELPTGAGKTLVGQLLGEYRRRVLGQRVAFVCPNTQLAAQAFEKAVGYGIPAVLLVGPKAGHNRSDITAFSRATAMAITNYHSVFNSNPAVDAQTLVLDDAHAGEEAVAGMWAVKAERGERLYDALLGAVQNALPRSFVERLKDDSLDPNQRRQVELVPPLAVAESAEILRDVIREHASDHNAWSGRMIADNVGHCLVYVAWDSVLVRPLLPPTSHHGAFADADQRIYMSATLAGGGELERSFGVTRIERLPVPAGWDEHGSGRRFFLFPAAVQDSHDVDGFIAQAIDRAGKALVLGSSRAEVSAFAGTAVPASVSVIRSGDIEQDIAGFTKADRGVLLLANRYDGIDLPDEACRLVVLTGLPAATHLQERYLHDVLGARRLLAERIRTRIIQGSGRCTRNVQDYAAVIVRGARLSDYCARDETQRPMHPELQAELQFGLDNCDRADVDLLELLDSFLKQDNEWIAADEDIQLRAADASSEVPSHADPLGEAAKFEVQSWQALWSGDLRRAIELAQEAADRLGGEGEVRPYRAFWLYLAASWAAELANEGGVQEDLAWAQTLRTDATAAARTLRWQPRFEARGPAPTPSAEFDHRAERASVKLRELGIRGPRLERKITEIQGQLAQDDATQFELGLEGLGQLLGFDATRPGGDAAPDSVWCDAGRLWLIFEAKTEEGGDHPISVKEVRQALSHADWVKAHYSAPDPDRSLTALVAYKSDVDSTAASIARETVLVDPGVVRDICERVLDLYRKVRPRARAQTEAELAATIAVEFKSYGLQSDDLIATLGERRLAEGES